MKQIIKKQKQNEKQTHIYIHTYIHIKNVSKSINNILNFDGLKMKNKKTILKKINK